MNLPWTWNDDDLLIKLIGEHDIVYWSDEPITFKSRIKSHVYVSGRSDLTGNGEALDIIASMLAYMTRDALSREILERKRIQFIGVPTAGAPIAAVAGAVRVPGMRAGSRTMREVQKAHGNDHTWVDGKPSADEFYVGIDNVITDGQSKFEFFERLRDDGYPAEEMLNVILIDRLQGGVKKLNDAGYRTIARITLPVVVRGLVDQGFWPKERLVRYMDEQVEWERTQKR